MRRFAVLVALSVGAAIGAAASARAASSDEGHALVMGGALNFAQSAAAHDLWGGERGLAVGYLSVPSEAVTAVSGAYGVGGYLAWSGDGYRLSATLRSFGDGGISAGLGASTGSTSYGVSLDGLLGGVLPLAPATNPLDGSPARLGSDVGVSFTVNHALSSGLSLMGTAETRHIVPTGIDAGPSSSDVVVGAGVGLRF